MRKILFTLVWLFSASMLCNAQNIATSTIKWNAGKPLDLSPGQIETATSITSNGASSLVWKNEDSTIRKTFQITEMIGEWSNISNDGGMRYAVTDGQFSGTISIRKQGDEITILIAITSDTPETIELSIRSVQLL